MNFLLCVPSTKTGSVVYFLSTEIEVTVLVTVKCQLLGKLESAGHIISPIQTNIEAALALPATIGHIQTSSLTSIGHVKAGSATVDNSLTVTDGNVKIGPVDPDLPNRRLQVDGNTRVKGIVDVIGGDLHVDADNVSFGIEPDAESGYRLDVVSNTVVNGDLDLETRDLLSFRWQRGVGW